MKNTILTNAINGRIIVAYVNGQNAPRTKCSNLYRAIIANGFTPDDIGKTIDIAIGAKRQHKNDGRKMAIVKI